MSMDPYTLTLFLGGVAVGVGLGVRLEQVMFRRKNWRSIVNLELAQIFRGGPSVGAKVEVEPDLTDESIPGDPLYDASEAFDHPIKNTTYDPYIKFVEDTLRKAGHPFDEGDRCELIETMEADRRAFEAMVDAMPPALPSCPVCGGEVPAGNVTCGACRCERLVHPDHMMESGPGPKPQSAPRMVRVGWDSGIGEPIMGVRCPCDRGGPMLPGEAGCALCVDERSHG